MTPAIYMSTEIEAGAKMYPLPRRALIRS
jgi:hypothetical protein